MSVGDNKVVSIGSTREWKEKWLAAFNDKKYLIVIEFTSKDYKEPCKIMSKEFKKLSRDSRFKNVAFFEVDVDKFSEPAQRYGLDVYPAFLLRSWNDNYLDRVTGINPQTLENSIAKEQKKMDDFIRWQAASNGGIAIRHDLVAN